MLIFKQVPGKLMRGKIMYTCEGITDILDSVYKKFYIDSGCYMVLHKIPEKFKLCDDKSWAMFSVRTKRRTIGSITVNGSGKIIGAEFKFGEDLFYNLAVVFKNLINKEIDLNELAIISFVQRSLRFEPKANKQILYFIANFVYHHGIDREETMINQFRAGYCYHFAMMLKNMFNDGEIYWCAPFGHMVYMHDNIPYDIEGVNDSDCDYYIPIEYIKDGITSDIRVVEYDRVYIKQKGVISKMQ